MQRYQSVSVVLNKTIKCLQPTLIDHCAQQVGKASEGWYESENRVKRQNNVPNYVLSHGSSSF